MSFRMVASANGVVSALTGLVAVIAPGVLASIYQQAVSEREASLIQALGASYLGFGLLLWMVRDAADTGVRRGVAAGSVVAWAVSLVISFIWLRLAGPAIWGNVALQVVFSVAWLYVFMASRIAPLTRPSSPGRESQLSRRDS